MSVAFGIVALLVAGAFATNPVPCVLVSSALAASIGLALFKDKREQANKVREAVKRAEQKRMELQASAWAELACQYGLPLPANTLCELYVAQNALHIQADGTSLRINVQDIRAAQVITTSEITTKAKDSETPTAKTTLELGAFADIAHSKAAAPSTNARRSKQAITICFVVINWTSANGTLNILAFEGSWDACNTIVAALPFGVQPA